MKCLSCLRERRGFKYIAAVLSSILLFSLALVFSYCVPERLMENQLSESVAQLESEGQYPSLMGGGSLLAA